MNGTGVKVVDASAIAAVVFDEPKGRLVARHLEQATLVAPSLIWFELVNIGVTKIRRFADRREAILQAFAMRAGLTIETQPVDYAGALLLAERTKLTGYDASYLWLARHLRAELITLHRELSEAGIALGLPSIGDPI